MTRPPKPCRSGGALTMPSKPATPCRSCRTLTTTPWCPACSARRGLRPGQRPYDTPEWRAISRATRAAQPACVDCGSTVDLCADHVAAGSLSEGTATRCRVCNGRKQDR